METVCREMNGIGGDSQLIPETLHPKNIYLDLCPFAGMIMEDGIDEKNQGSY
jgi:hypothetical protein